VSFRDGWWLPWRWLPPASQPGTMGFPLAQHEEDGKGTGWLRLCEQVTYALGLPPHFQGLQFTRGENINLISLHRAVVIIGLAVGQSMVWSQCLHFGGLSGWSRRVSGWLPGGHPAHLRMQKAASALTSQPHGMAPAWTRAFMPCPCGLKQQKKNITAMAALRL